MHCLLKSFHQTITLKTFFMKKVQNACFPQSLTISFLVNFFWNLVWNFCLLRIACVTPGWYYFFFCCFLWKYLTVITMHFPVRVWSKLKLKMISDEFFILNEVFQVITWSRKCDFLHTTVSIVHRKYEKRLCILIIKWLMELQIDIFNGFSLQFLPLRQCEGFEKDGVL